MARMSMNELRDVAASADARAQADASSGSTGLVVGGALAICFAVGIGWLAASTGTTDEQVVSAEPALANVEPVRVVQSLPVEDAGAAWDRDFQACAKSATGGGSYGAYSISYNGSDPMGVYKVEPLIVICLAKRPVANRCSPAYRKQLLAFARPVAVRAASVSTEHSRELGSGTRRTQQIDIGPITRRALRSLFADGAVQPEDFGGWVSGVPALVTEVAGTMNVPARPC